MRGPYGLGRREFTLAGGGLPLKTKFVLQEHTVAVALENLGRDLVGEVAVANIRAAH